MRPHLPCGIFVTHYNGARVFGVVCDGSSSVKFHAMNFDESDYRLGDLLQTVDNVARVLPGWDYLHSNTKYFAPSDVLGNSVLLQGECNKQGHCKCIFKGANVSSFKMGSSPCGFLALSDTMMYLIQ